MNSDEEQNKDNLPQFLTVEGAANLLKVSTMTIYRYIKDTENPLPVIYLSDKTIRIPYGQFNLWLDSKKEGGEVNVDNTQ